MLLRVHFGSRSLLIPKMANRGRYPLRQSWAKTIILLVAFPKVFFLLYLKFNTCDIDTSRVKVKRKVRAMVRRDLMAVVMIKIWLRP